MIRWIFLLRYPDGIPVEEGERWYLRTHTQEAKRMKGLLRYQTWKMIEAPEPAAGMSTRSLNKYVRMTEVGFEDWESLRAAVIENPPDFTPPPYADRLKAEGRYRGGFLADTIFIGEDPQFDLLRDVPDAP